MRTAILDDEPLAVEVLVDYVKKSSILELIYAGSDAFSLLEKVQEGEIDLVFLDIQMPELSGIQFLKIASNKCKFIVTTAYTEYALDGYDYNIVDYLLKPISYARFYKAIQKSQNQDIIKSHIPKFNPVLKDYLFVKSEYKTLKIELCNILYIKSASDYVEYHMTDNSKILSLDSLKLIVKRLKGFEFCQTHKSYVINIKHVNYIERNRVVMSNNDRIPIGDHYRKSFINLINAT